MKAKSGNWRNWETGGEAKEEPTLENQFFSTFFGGSQTPPPPYKIFANFSFSPVSQFRQFPDSAVTYTYIKNYGIITTIWTHKEIFN